MMISKNECFSNTSSFNNLIQNIDVKKLRYNYKYDPVLIDEQARSIYKMSRKHPRLLKEIDSKMMEIYKEIIINDKLKNYLFTNNLIDRDGMPIFLNNRYESFVNKIKIILIVKNI